MGFLWIPLKPMNFTCGLIAAEATQGKEQGKELGLTSVDHLVMTVTESSTDPPAKPLDGLDFHNRATLKNATSCFYFSKKCWLLVLFNSDYISLIKNRDDYSSAT